MRFHLFAFGLLVAAFSASAARACDAPPPALLVAEDKLRAQLREAPEPILAQMDAYSIAMEACYDSVLGPLELAPFAKQAAALSAHMAGLRRAAEDEVRGDEFAYEDLLASDYWGHIEALRVAAAYGEAWGQLAMAVRHISAEDKKTGLRAAQEALRQLTLEFKHPQLVQRAMYGLATAQIEGGQLADAKASLERLQSSLKRGGSKDFTRAVNDFHARISDPAYRPPPLLFGAPKPVGTKTRAQTTGAQGGMAAVELARQALREARSAEEITALIRPALSSDEVALRAALDLLSRDQLLLEAMDYEPGQSLRVMRLAFASGQYGQLRAAWAGVKPFYPHLPIGLKRRVDYQLGVALLNLGELERAITHLWAARQSLNDGPQATLIDKLIALAQLSFDSPPDAARLALAQSFQDLALPPAPAAGGPQADAPPPLDVALILRARVVLARHAALQKDWQAADKWLSGIGPDMAGYRLFLGMRVRILAEAVKAEEKAEARAKTARGAHALYRLWQNSACPPGCLTGDRAAVHRAAVALSIDGNLPPEAFGLAFGSFVAEGGDARPLMKRALSFLITAQDAVRLMQLLEPADEAQAGYVLGQWKKHLVEEVDMVRAYDWLASALNELQGRPQAVLLEALIAHDLQTDRAPKALPHAEKLAADFPRRPSAWFYRAAVLAANDRTLEGARALASLAGRTPADDPVGMGARLGLAALFVELERREQACAMRAKIFSRPQSGDLWQIALGAFPMLGAWQVTADKACGA